MLNILTLPRPDAAAHEIKPEDLPPILQSTQSVTWIRCLAPSDADLAWLQDAFALHPLTIEDCRHRNQRPTDPVTKL